jgi:hypothetical protein
MTIDYGRTSKVTFNQNEIVHIIIPVKKQNEIVQLQTKSSTPSLQVQQLYDRISHDESNKLVHDVCYQISWTAPPRSGIVKENITFILECDTHTKVALDLPIRGETL